MLPAPAEGPGNAGARLSMVNPWNHGARDATDQAQCIPLQNR